jgi:hypothetical protein
MCKTTIAPASSMPTNSRYNTSISLNDRYVVSFYAVGVRYNAAPALLPLLWLLLVRSVHRAPWNTCHTLTHPKNGSAKFALFEFKQVQKFDL